jgi:hypothetical protein
MTAAERAKRWRDQKKHDPRWREQERARKRMGRRTWPSKELTAENRAKTARRVRQSRRAKGLPSLVPGKLHTKRALQVLERIAWDL